MLKGILIGCGTLVLIALIAFGFLAWQGIKFGKRVAGDMQATQQRISDLNAKFAFTPPPALEEGQVDRWLAVRTQMTSATVSIRQHMESLKDREAGALEAVKAGLGVMGVMQQQMNDQIALLEQAGMSLKEYVWVGGQLVSTLRSQAAHADAALTSLTVTMDAAVDAFEAEAASSPTAGMPGAGPARDAVTSVFDMPLSTEQISRNLEVIRTRHAELMAALERFTTDFMLLTVGLQGASSILGTPAEAPEPAEDPAAEPNTTWLLPDPLIIAA